MSSKCILIVISVVIVSCTYGAPNHDQMKCAGTELKFTDEMKKSRSSCNTKYLVGKSDTKEPKMNFNVTCNLMCEFQGYGVISQDGKVDKTNMANFVKTVFPTNVQDGLSKLFTNCADEKGTGLSVTADGDCKNYIPFLTCILQAQVKVCKWDKRAPA